MFQKSDSSSSSGQKREGSKAVDTPVRKSDRRKLRNNAAAFFSKTADDDTSLLDSIFLQDSLVLRKLTQHKQFNATVHLYFRGPSTNTKWPYTSTTECVWMTVDVGPNTPPVDCPSVATMSVMYAADISMPCVTIPSHASKFVCRGAHVMRAGIIAVSPEGSHTGTIVAIKAYGNPQPFAVGQLKSKTTGNESEGIGVDVWMCYGDDIYQTTTALAAKTTVQKDAEINPIGGAPFSNGHYGNVGFTDGKFVQAIVRTDDSDEDEQSSGDNDENETDDEGRDAAVSTMTDDDNEEKGKEEEPSMDPDDVLHYATCQALINIKDKELPLAASIFYATHVLPNRLEGTTIQLKQTSFKKFGTYLLHQQNDCNLLTLAQDKKDNNPAGFLQSINRRHVDLRGFKKTVAAGAEKPKSKMAIVMLKVVPNHFISLMRLNDDDVKASNAKSVDRRGTGMLTTPEVRAILEQYCRVNDLIAPDATEVTLDGPLTDALFKKSKCPPPPTLSRKALNDAWVAKMEPAYAVVQMPGSKITKLARGVPPKVQIEVSKRSGRNKFSTRLRGIEEYGIDGNDFCHDVMKRFACSGTIEVDEPIMGNLKKGHVELVFQGHLIEELRALLLGEERLTSHGGAKNSEYSIPKQSIVVTLKKGVPAKKAKK